MKRAFPLLVALSVGFGAAESARAQARDAAGAEALFNEGRAELQAGHLDAACSKFKESYRLDPAVGTLLNWANCLGKRGKLASAWHRFKQAADELEPGDDRLPYARSEAKALEARLPKLAVVLDGAAPEGMRVMRDEVVLGKASLGTPLPVDPGRHVIRIEAPGHEPRMQTVALAEAETKTIRISVGALLPEKTANTAEDPIAASGDGRRTWGFVAAGVGLAGIAGATVTGVMLMDKRKQVDAHCEARVCDQIGLDAAEQGQTLLVVNAVGWGVGIAGAGLATYLFVTAPDATNSPSGFQGLDLGLLPGGAAARYEVQF